MLWKVHQQALHFVLPLHELPYNSVSFHLHGLYLQLAGSACSALCLPPSAASPPSGPPLTPPHSLLISCPSNLTPPSPLTPTPSLLPHPDSLLYHPSPSLFPLPSSLIPYPSTLISHPSCLTPFPHPSPLSLIPYPLPFLPKPSSLISYPWSLIPSYSPLIPHHSSLTIHPSPYIPHGPKYLCFLSIIWLLRRKLHFICIYMPILQVTDVSWGSAGA